MTAAEYKKERIGASEKVMDWLWTVGVWAIGFFSLMPLKYEKIENHDAVFMIGERKIDIHGMTDPQQFMDDFKRIAKGSVEMKLISLKRRPPLRTITRDWNK